jgi:trimeric autotransporter adhesin
VILIAPDRHHRNGGGDFEEKDSMAQHSAIPVLTAVALTALIGSLALPAAGDPPKPGTIVTVAGTGTPGYAGDNGPAPRALLNGPSALALDAAGNLYIADAANFRVRKVSPDGTITTVAGTGTPGFSGDGGKATEAQLNRAEYVAVDRAGNLFIVDVFNHRVRKVTPDGIISTVAGSGPVEQTSDPGIPQYGGFSGDNDLATHARLNGPHGLAVDAVGNLYIGDYYNHRVRKVDAVTGVITTVAGNGSDRSSGDGGPATQAGMFPFDLAIDAKGDLYIADNPIFSDFTTYRVRKVDAVTGIITTVAGNGEAGFSGDGGPATAGMLAHPASLAVDSAGNLFIADWDNYRVRKVDAVSGNITTVAGIGQSEYAGDGGLATDTGLRGPSGLAIDPMGNMLISDSGGFHAGDGLADNDRVVKVFGVAAPGLLAGMAFPQ